MLPMVLSSIFQTYPMMMIPTTKEFSPGSWVDMGSYYEYIFECNGYDASGIKMKVDDTTNTLHIKGIMRHHQTTQHSTSTSVSEFTHQVSIPSDAVATSMQAQMLHNQIIITVMKESRFIPIE